tara:strand:+ start:154 stop:450 length:297 start_codon:yes stop_codon:yes gene_type:complete
MSSLISYYQYIEKGIEKMTNQANPYNEIQQRRLTELYKSINYYEERVDDARYHSLQDMNRDMITMLTAELEQIESSVPQSMKESRVANIKSQMLVGYL